MYGFYIILILPANNVILDMTNDLIIVILQILDMTNDLIIVILQRDRNSIFFLLFAIFNVFCQIFLFVDFIYAYRNNYCINLIFCPIDLFCCYPVWCSCIIFGKMDLTLAARIL